jgi:hypothetical protein
VLFRTVTLSVGNFLQCNGESESSAWSCHSNADLGLINQREGTKLSRKIGHIFYSKENNWNDVQDPDEGYIKARTIDVITHVVNAGVQDGCIIFEVKVNADAPLGQVGSRTREPLII